MAHKSITEARKKLLANFKKLDHKNAIMRDPALKALYAEIPKLPQDERSSFGQDVNKLKQELQDLLDKHTDESIQLKPIDVTAPFDVNIQPEDQPTLLSIEAGTTHPLMQELDKVIGIFERMGFQAIESRQIDDEFHMFDSLNFPKDHPARDDYDTFRTDKGLIAPAHTSTMQHRVLKAGAAGLKEGNPIQVLIPGRVFRNEDLDARHEHTFYQFEGVYVSEGVTVGNLIATLKTFLETYYSTSLEFKTQPFYFPFTEPSFEFALSCPFCEKQGCKVCSQTGWIELLGCGMIHPNVLKQAGIDPKKYTGFAWGSGVERLVMMKHDIEDVRHFESGKLSFLRQFK